MSSSLPTQSVMLPPFVRRVGRHWRGALAVMIATIAAYVKLHPSADYASSWQGLSLASALGCSAGALWACLRTAFRESRASAPQRTGKRAAASPALRAPAIGARIMTISPGQVQMPSAPARRASIQRGSFASSDPLPASSRYSSVIDTSGEASASHAVESLHSLQPDAASASSARAKDVALTARAVRAAVGPRAPETFIALPPRALEELEELRSQLYLLAADSCFVIAVASDARSQRLKSELAVRLAWALARKGEANVLLLEADFRKPALARTLGLEVPPLLGLSQQILRGDERAPTVLRMTAPVEHVGAARVRLDVLAEGRVRTPGVPPEAFSRALIALRAHYDLIVADSGAVRSGEELSSLHGLADGALFATSAQPAPGLSALLSGFGEPKRLLKMFPYAGA